MSNPVNISDAVPLLFISVDLTYIGSFSSDSSVLSFQFARVSPSVSGQQILALEDEDEESVLLLFIVLHHTHTVPLH